jgi:hypothetical protein|tara:strand:- start:1503 stop:1679 length:177 start_codon:yes stop_codon:yes gene_type:complete
MNQEIDREQKLRLNLSKTERYVSILEDRNQKQNQENLELKSKNRNLLKKIKERRICCF